MRLSSGRPRVSLEAPSAPIIADLGLPPICTSIGDFEAQRATLQAWADRAAELSLETSPVRPILVNAIVADTDEAAWRWSVGDMMGRMYREDFLPLLKAFGFATFLTALGALAGLVLAAVAIARRHARSLVVFLPLVVGVLVFAFIAVEVVVGHD